MLRTVTATRYVTPMREGGSLPGLVEADDLGTYVVKFVGAGQGRKALVAEVVVGELARRLGLPVPDIVLVDLDPVVAKGEPDQEVQDLLRASAGTNLGLDFLPGSMTHDAGAEVAPDLAASLLWLDAFVENVDRSWRNPNLLRWHGDLWLIDHGAALYFHHDWPRAATKTARPYDASDHVLRAATDRSTPLPVTGELLDEVLALVPDPWLTDEPGFDTPAALRAAYRSHLLARLDAEEAWRP